MESPSRRPVLPRETRERLVLDTAKDLFYARGGHEVGMDELVRATGLGKATVYRLFATKDELIGAYLRRLAGDILALIDTEIERHTKRRERRQLQPTTPSRASPARR